MDETASPKIAVLGAGLIGCYIGGRLAAAGADVTLIGRPRVIGELRDHGLTVTDLHGFTATVPAAALKLSEQPSPLADADLIILAAKSHGTEAAAAEIARLARPGAVVLSLQNGVSNAGKLRAALPGVQVVAGIVPYNVAQPELGRFHQGTGGELIAEAGTAIAPFAPLFAAAGLPLTLAADMTGMLWGKLFMNLSNAINALSGVPLARQFADRDLRRALAMSQRETLGLLRRAGIVPASLMPMPNAVLPWLLSLPNALYRRVAARSKAPRIDRHARSSMAEDLALGRTTEVDFLNGEVVALATRLGRRAPVNARLIALVRAAEQGAPPLSGPALRAELRRAR